MDISISHTVAIVAVDFADVAVAAAAPSDLCEYIRVFVFSGARVRMGKRLCRRYVMSRENIQHTFRKYFSYRPPPSLRPNLFMRVGAYRCSVTKNKRHDSKGQSREIPRDRSSSEGIDFVTVALLWEDIPCVCVCTQNIFRFMYGPMKNVLG